MKDNETADTIAVKKDLPNNELSNKTDKHLRLDEESTCIEVRDYNLYYGNKQALKNIKMTIPEKRVTAFIGPSGCGKSTLLRSFNRMNDLIDIVNTEGEILINDENILNHR